MEGRGFESLRLQFTQVPPSAEVGAPAEVLERLRVALDILKHDPVMYDVRRVDLLTHRACLPVLVECCAGSFERSVQQEAVCDVMIPLSDQPDHHDVRFSVFRGLRHFENRASRTALNDDLGHDEKEWQ